MLHHRTWHLLGRKMANEATNEELRELEDILRANPEMHFVLQTLTTSGQQNPSDNFLQIDRAYAAHIEKMRDLGMQVPGEEEPDNTVLLDTEPQQRSFRLPYIIIGTLGVVTLLLIMLFSNTGHQATVAEPVKNEVATINGSKKQLVLPDGTKVWLNSGTKLTYDKTFTAKQREVVLTGEAYFDVTHDADHPFIIHTSVMDIKVLGTEFNVKSYPGEPTTEASLIRGQIEVTLKNSHKGKIVLKPNEKIIVSNDKEQDSVHQEKPHINEPIISLGRLSYFSEDSTVLETSWINNRLVFEDESFADLAINMERWYGVNIQFADTEVESLRFTGSFKQETITQALEAMRITADFNYSIHNNNITITKK